MLGRDYRTEVDPGRMMGKEKAVSRQTFVTQTIKIVKLSELDSEETKEKRRQRNETSHNSRGHPHTPDTALPAIQGPITTTGVGSDMIGTTASGATSSSGEPTGPAGRTLAILVLNQGAGVSSTAVLGEAQLGQPSTGWKRKKDANSPTSSAVVDAGGKSPKRRLTSSDTASDKEISSNDDNDVLTMDLDPPLQESSTRAAATRIRSLHDMPPALYEFALRYMKKIAPEATDDDLQNAKLPQAFFEHLKSLSAASFQSHPQPVISRETSSPFEQVPQVPGQDSVLSLVTQQEQPAPDAPDVHAPLNPAQPSHEPASAPTSVQNLLPGAVIPPSNTALPYPMGCPPRENGMNISYRPEDNLLPQETIPPCNTVVTNPMGCPPQENGTKISDRLEDDLPPQDTIPPSNTIGPNPTEYPPRGDGTKMSDRQEDNLLPQENIPLPNPMGSPPRENGTNIPYHPEERLRSLHTIFLIRDILHFMTTNTARTRQAENGGTPTDADARMSAPPSTPSTWSSRSAGIEHPCEQRDTLDSPFGPATDFGGHINRTMSVDERLDIFAHASVSLAKHLFPYRGLVLEKKIEDLDQKLVHQTEQLGGISGFGVGGWLPVSATAMREAQVARERAMEPAPPVNTVASVSTSMDSRAIQTEVFGDNKDVDKENTNHDEDDLEDIHAFTPRLGDDKDEAPTTTSPSPWPDSQNDGNVREKRKGKDKDHANNVDSRAEVLSVEIAKLQQQIQEERKSYEDELSRLRESLKHTQEELRKEKEEKENAAHPALGSVSELDIQKMKARMQALEERAAAVRSPASPASGSERSDRILGASRSGQHKTVSSYHPLSHLMAAGSSRDAHRPPS